MKLIKIRQRFDAEKIGDLDGHISREMGRAAPLIRPGQKIALAVGSRNPVIPGSK